MTSPRSTRLARTLAGAICLFCLIMPLSSFAQSFTTLVDFDGLSNGRWPYGNLVQAADGNFYGTTLFGGANQQGTVFKLTPEGSLTTLHSFCSLHNCSDGSAPYAALVQGFDGNFYGTTSTTVFRITSAGDLTTLYTFCSQPNCADGNLPYSGLVQGADGNFYGAASSGGISTYACFGPCGTIFKITPGGVLTTLYSFRGIDGSSPFGTLVQGSDGNFYGTTTFGGAHHWGTVFKITPSGVLTLLHSFGGSPSDGLYPYGWLVQGSDGNFYGTTFGGGRFGGGTVYKITPTGVETVLRSLNLTSNGYGPYDGLLLASDGNFYGAAFGGGSGLCLCGTLFRVTPAGKLTTLYNFCSQSNCTDGDSPFAGLIQGSDGNLYGTTSLGGIGNCDPSCGTAFKLSLGLPIPDRTVRTKFPSVP